MKTGRYMLTHIALSAAIYEYNRRVQTEKHHQSFVKAMEGSIEKFVRALDIQEAQIRHLCHILEENNVELTDFDLIVFNINNQG